LRKGRGDKSGAEVLARKNPFSVERGHSSKRGERGTRRERTAEKI